MAWLAAGIALMFYFYFFSLLACVEVRIRRGSPRGGVYIIIPNVYIYLTTDDCISFVDSL